GRPRRPRGAFSSSWPPGWPQDSRKPGAEPVILGKRPDIERFLKAPTVGVRAALIYGRDLGVVRERGQELAGRIAKDPNDPFDVAQLTDGDLDGDSGRLEGELAAQSLMGGRRLVRLRFASEKAALDKLAAEALARHADGELNPD